MAKKRRKKHKRKITTMTTEKGGTFVTKSSYETRYAEILESDPKVIRFTYEPFKIPYTFRGREINYIPDFLVEFICGKQQLVEVKPKRFVGSPRNRAKFKAGKDHEIDFIVITESELGI